MITLNATELRNGVIFKEAGQLLQVLNYEHKVIGRGSGNIKVKVRNLKTGAITERSFFPGAKVQAASIEKKKVTFLYTDGQTYNFMDPQNFEQFTLGKSLIADQAVYLKDGLELQLVVNDEEALGIELPNGLVYQITEADPGERGNTASSVYKNATLDNGLVVKVPMFINVGDKVKVDTRTGNYIERVK